MTEPLTDAQLLTSRRFGTPESALDAYTALREGSATRREYLAHIENQLNGAKPFDVSKLITAGQSNRTNINFRDASFMKDERVISLWGLYTNVSSIADVQVRDAVPEAQNIEEIFQEAYMRFLDEDWGSAAKANTLLLIDQQVSFGVGTGVFNSAESPRWTSIRRSKVEVPARSKVDINSLDVVCLSDTLSPVALWSYIATPADESAAKSVGWNTDLIKKLLLAREKHIDVNLVQQNDAQSYVDSLRSNELGVSERFSAFDIVYVFSVEKDGKVTKQIILPGDEGFSSVKEWLFDDYEVSGRPESLKEVLFFIFSDAGNGEFNSVKGFGSKNYHIASMITRLRCDMIDRISLTDGLNVTNTDDSVDGAKLKVLRTGSLNVFPRNLTPIQIPTGNGQTENVIQTLENLYQRNNAGYTAQTELIAQAATKAQGQMISGNSSRVDIATSSYFLSQMQALLTEQFRRLRLRGSHDADAIRFKKRCVDLGMDPEAFYKYNISVSTGAIAAAVNGEGLAQTFAQLVQWGGLPDVSQRFAVAGYVAQRLGAPAVRKALMPSDSQYKDDEQGRLAIMENGFFNLKNPLPVAKQDRHDIHIPMHLSVVTNAANAYQNRQAPLTQDFYIIFRLSIEHLKQHFDFLKQDFTRKAAFAEYFPSFTTAVNVLAQMEHEIQSATQAQAAQQVGASPNQLPKQQSLVQAMTPEGGSPNELRTSPESQVSQLEAQALGTEA